MLRMVLPEPARLGLDMARTILDPESFKTLAVRTLGLEDAEQYLAGGDRPTRLKVGFFGGLSVTTPQGSIQDSDWRKRKSRLLFAMLVARRGEDIPKDLLFERLWPEMDEDRAKSNFYVIWSAMRRVLCSDSQTGDCPYVEHRAGVCRAVADRIVSDLDEFDAITADLRAAERARNIQDAIEAGERLCMVYHGDVLPGDLYDDWFGPLRERYRDAFGDAMLLAAELAADGGQTEASLRFIRAGLAQDLWREDLYQAALRYQIGSGQRSSAIETYFACRSKLADDLGLDPSAETQRLYEQVLAMEPAPSKVGRY
jgi:DNA-binding SARP family transcriptional activator